jgi:hypothetical protein
MSKSSDTAKLSSWEFPVVGLLAWLVPGAGHFYLGLRKRALLLFIAIELTYFIGLYIGTIRVVDPAHSMFWFVAQVFAGLNTIIARLWAVNLANSNTVLNHDWSYSMAVLYTGIAGLLNLLAIFDSVIRAGRANLGQEPLPGD